ncbi:hypothetical protein CDL15_Pgr025940 [Punica granatum]|uniref:Uncharacterized protein n=1 Tax=Punica granatum TaxID=22663 RepID=A0A218WCM3_PUNGR|nr:hypothetical protein CDL15_Pgr025940 [Punica granatum]
MSTHHILGLKKVPRVQLFADSTIEPFLDQQKGGSTERMKRERNRTERLACFLIDSRGGGALE